MTFLPNVTCLIPHYNEDERLDRVLDEITKVGNLAEIICVDDGSSIDRTAELEAKYPNVTFYRLEKNVGKSGAIEAMIPHLKTEYVMLFDADLSNLNYREIEYAVDLMKPEEIDMLVLRRKNDFLIAKVSRGDLLFTGERILRVSDLKAIYARRNVDKWMIETATNTYMYRNGKNVKWTDHSGENTLKLMKYGMKRAVTKEPRMLYDIVAGADNLREFMKVMLYFCRKNQKVEMEVE